MGIFITLHVADNVTEKEWEAVYEESLRMARQFHLLDYEVTTLCGGRLFCGIPVIEHEEQGQYFWRTVGDSVTMGRAEVFQLPRKLHRQLLFEPEKGICHDPLLSIAADNGLLDRQNPRGRNNLRLWGNKTQGEAYHTYLLAIGCMIEARLEGKACVWGDITLGQCRKAAALANRCLDEPIGMPVQCELERLYQRISRLPLKEGEPLAVFQALYLGALDREYGIFVKEHFSAAERIGYWQNKFAGCRVSTREFSLLLKTYFDLGNCVEDLCPMVQYVDKDGNEYYELFIKALVACQPLRKIRGTLQDYLGDHCDVQGILMERVKQPPVVLNGRMTSRPGFPMPNMEIDDIREFRELPHYEPGDKIKPSLMAACLKYLKFYKNVCAEEQFTKLMEASSETKGAFLISRNRSLFLMKNRWLEIIDEIDKDPESFRRYYPMVRVKINDDSKYLIYAYVVNEDFYQAVCLSKSAYP